MKNIKKAFYLTVCLVFTSITFYAFNNIYNVNKCKEKALNCEGELSSYSYVSNFFRESTCEFECK